MCFHHPLVASLSKWNWDGGSIVHDCIVPSSRWPVGRRGGKQYEMDVREFLVSENNAIMKRTLREKLPDFMRALNEDPVRFQGRAAGSFDYRAHIISAYIADTIRYDAKKGHDPWQFPEETLFLSKGDCEDIAFLLASLLIASGISPYNIRVALGKVRTNQAGKRITYDHMWVMYKNENGHWLLLEPLQLNSEKTKTGNQPPGGKAGTKEVFYAEYIPMFLFNNNHLWYVGNNKNPASFSDTVSRSWQKLNPKFAGAVHQTILNEALSSVAPRFILDALNRHFSRILGISPVVDDIDNFLTHGYDPRDHFDNGFIDEGWELVAKRLQGFKSNNVDLDSFAYAAHGIADFYAHSSYLHFAKINNDLAGIYDAAKLAALCENPPGYDADSSFNLASGPFSMNTNLYKGTRLQAVNQWKEKIISGRYAQKGDSQAKALEKLTFIPKELTGGDFNVRGSLPHHNEIAVDDSTFDSAHKLYKKIANPQEKDRLAYSNQFKWRKKTAIAHIRTAFVDCWRS